MSRKSKQKAIKRKEKRLQLQSLKILAQSPENSISSNEGKKGSLISKEEIIDVISPDEQELKHTDNTEENHLTSLKEETLINNEGFFNIEEKNDTEHKTQKENCINEKQATTRKLENQRGLGMMEAGFRQALKRPNLPVKDKAAIQYQLAKVLERRCLFKQALNISNEIIQAMPENDSYRDQNKQLKELADQCVDNVDPLIEAKRIEEIERIFNDQRQIDEQRFNEMQFEEKKENSIVPTISDHLSRQLVRYSSYKERPMQSVVQSKMIATNTISIAKPLFNSSLELLIYKVVLEHFPNCLIYANMALQSIFYYEQMKPLLSGEDFEYFLKAHVDFCVIRTTDYFPILSIEVDGVDHDKIDRIEKDEIKNQIFRTGGIPLLRIRPRENPSDEMIQQEVTELLRNWQQEAFATSSGKK